MSKNLQVKYNKSWICLKIFTPSLITPSRDQPRFPAGVRDPKGLDGLRR